MSPPRTDLPLYAVAYTQIRRALESQASPMALDQFSGLVVAAQYRYLYDLTLRWVPARSRVLDWGCGDGHFSYFLLGQGYTVDSFSVQNRPALFDRLPQSWRDRHSFVQTPEGDTTSLPYPDSTFDAVFSVGVLEHVRETGGNESASLREIYRILRPGGRFICFHLPNQYSYIEWISRRLFRDAPDDEHRRYHLYRFSQAQAVRLFTGTGFKIERASRYAFFPRNVLGRLPRFLTDSITFTQIANSLDRLFEHLFAPIAQNNLIIATKLTILFS